MLVQNRAIKYRIYPTKEQETLFYKTFGCCRFVYNHYLAMQQERHRCGEKHMGKTDCNNDCNRVLKQEYPWLREVDKFALTNAIYNLEDAFQRFFARKGGYPKFKSRRRSRMSYTTNITGNNIAITDGGVKLPKAGAVRARLHRMPEPGWEVKSATVSMDPDGKFYCSVMFAYEAEIKPVPVSKAKALGLDFKVSALYMDSNGECADMPRYYKRSMDRLAKAQQALARKQGSRKGEENSANFKKQRKKVAKLQRKTANQRRDYLHKVSTYLAEHYDMVCVEDILVKEVLGAHPYHAYRRTVYDNGWYMFTQMLGYKLPGRGKVFWKIEKDYPSSQECSACGYINPELADDGIRKWACPVCVATHDRDINAAVNIREEGWREYTYAA